MGAASSWTVLIAAHAIAASYALVLGPVQLLRRKRGDRAHRLIGRTWVAAMAVTIVTSFFIVELDGFLFWFLHGLSLLTAVTVTLGVAHARRGRIASHRASMTGSYLGLVGAFIGVIAVPTRRVDQTALYDPGLFWLIAALIGASCAVGVLALGRTPTGATSGVQQEPERGAGP